VCLSQVTAVQGKLVKFGCISYDQAVMFCDATKSFKKKSKFWKGEKLNENPGV
jgi:hypothetical protein